MVLAILGPLALAGLVRDDEEGIVCYVATGEGAYSVYLRSRNVAISCVHLYGVTP